MGYGGKLELFYSSIIKESFRSELYSGCRWKSTLRHCLKILLLLIPFNSNLQLPPPGNDVRVFLERGEKVE